MNFTGFSKLNREQRYQRLLDSGILNKEDIVYLQQSVATDVIQLAEQCIENAIGCFPLPLGVAVNLTIDKRDYVVPMAIEETSVIAAVSHMAKWIKQHGEITTEIQGNEIIGQIQIAKVKNFLAFKNSIDMAAPELIQLANKQVVPNLVARGGGVTRITVREIARDDGDIMAVIHVFLNPCDAMGANLINQVCEFLKEPIEQLTHEKINLCILSNLVDGKLTKATITLKNIDPIVAEGIEEASIFAESDPYRAATNNKGVLNGIDAVVIATGNDWRAVEAGVHAYAARSGQYQSLTTWRRNNNDLIGTLVAPIIVGTVGGMTRLHPTAQLCLRMLNIKHADELARVIAAVGLVQNLAAIKALSGAGIVQGHMKLHIRNMLLAMSASEKEQKAVKPQLEKFLKTHGKITESDVKKIMSDYREQN